MAKAHVIQFAKDIARNLYPDNSLIKNSMDDTAYIKGKQVRFGVSGAVPEIVTNPTEFPLTVKEIGDTDDGYDLDLIATLPTRIGDLDEMLVNYGMRENALMEHRDVLSQRFVDTILYKWGPTLAARQVRTSGGSTGSGPTGSTGTRKLAVYADFVDAQAIFNATNVPLEGRCMGVPANMLSDILKINEFKDYDKLGVGGVIANGAVGKILGFDVFVRDKILRYSNAGTPVIKAHTTAVASADNSGILFWHKSLVRRAEGSPTPYLNEGLGTMLGSTLNFALYGGGAKRRATAEDGVVALIQAA